MSEAKYTFIPRQTGGFEIKDADNVVVGYAAEHGRYDTVYARLGTGRWGFHSSRYAVCVALRDMK